MKKNAFTLIELLAVIIILGLIALLIIPRIRNTIDDAKKNSNEVSVNALSRTATNYYLEQKTQKKDIENCTYDFTNKINTCTGLEFTGEKPDSGRLTIKKNGDIALAVQFDKYCFLKGYETDEIERIEYNQSTCGENAYVFTNYEMPLVVTTGAGLYESQTEIGRYIYRGENPNNYILLKENNVDTYYRIVSFEQDGTIKVVRNDSIGNKTWDDGTARQNTNTGYYCTSANGCNVWSNNEKTLFNNNPVGNNFFYKYFQTSDSDSLTDFTTQSGLIEEESTLNKYLNNDWLTETKLDTYIMPHNFYVGGVYYFQNYEGKDKGIEKEKQEEQTYTWNGKVGLMNITEMVESSTNPSCTSVYSNYRYNYPNYYYQGEGETEKTEHAPANNNYPCKTNNWALKTGWSLCPYSSTRNSVWIVSSSGNMGYGNASSTFGVRPAFYLKSSIRFTGTGSYADPYIITNM